MEEEGKEHENSSARLEKCKNILNASKIKLRQCYTSHLEALEDAKRFFIFSPAFWETRRCLKEVNKLTAKFDECMKKTYD